MKPGPGSATPEGEAGFPRPAYAWYVVFVIFFANAFAFLDRIVVALLTPALQADLGLSDSQAGLLQGLGFALFYTLFGLPMGWIVDRWNRKWLLSIGMAAWSVMTALCGMASKFSWLLLARLGVGVGEATLSPCVASLIGDYFPPRTRPKAFGVFIMGTTFGAGLTYAVGGVLLGWLTRNGGLDLPVLGHLKPWQAMFVIVGLPGLIPALLFMLTVREPTRQEVANKDRKGASVAQIRSFSSEHRKTLIIVYSGLTLILMPGYIFVNWLPTFFLRNFNWEPSQFSIAYGPGVFLAGIVGGTTAGLLATWFKDRNRSDGTLRGCLIGGIGSTTFAVLGALMPNPYASLACYILANLAATYIGVLGLSTIAEIIPNEMRGVMTASYYMLVNLLAGGFSPLFIGLVTDYVFQDKMAIGKSMILVTFAAGLAGTILVYRGLKYYRDSLDKATWLTPMQVKS